MNKTEFASILAAGASQSGGGGGAGAGGVLSSMDPFDRTVFYFLLFGKHIRDHTAIAREFASDEEVFHYRSDDEASASLARRQYLEGKISIGERASELFFSQLKTSDIMLYAERFWNNVIVKMTGTLIRCGITGGDKLQPCKIFL